MFNNFILPNNHILILIRIQFHFCIAEPTLNRGRKIIKHALNVTFVKHYQTCKHLNQIQNEERYHLRRKDCPFIIYPVYLVKAACYKKKVKDQEPTLVAHPS